MQNKFVQLLLPLYQSTLYVDNWVLGLYSLKVRVYLGISTSTSTSISHGKTMSTSKVGVPEKTVLKYTSTFAPYLMPVFLSRQSIFD